MTAAPTPDRVFKTGFGFCEAKVLLSAVELGLFTELAKGPAGPPAVGALLQRLVHVDHALVFRAVVAAFIPARAD